MLNLLDVKFEQFVEDFNLQGDLKDANPELGDHGENGAVVQYSGICNVAEGDSALER